MKKIRTILFILGAISLAAAPCWAGERRLSLGECLDQALKNNPDILRAAQALEAARGRRL